MNNGIKLAKSKTQFDLNLEAIDEPLSLLSNKIVSAVHDLNTSFNALWSLDDDSIEEILNYFGIETVIGVFTAHWQTGTALNQILEARGIPEPRATVSKPRDFTVNPETGEIKLVPLPEPEVVEEIPIDIPDPEVVIIDEPVV